MCQGIYTGSQIGEPTLYFPQPMIGCETRDRKNQVHEDSHGSKKDKAPPESQKPDSNSAQGSRQGLRRAGGRLILIAGSRGCVCLEWTLTHPGIPLFFHSVIWCFFHSVIWCFFHSVIWCCPRSWRRMRFRGPLYQERRAGSSPRPARHSVPRVPYACVPIVAGAAYVQGVYLSPRALDLWCDDDALPIDCVMPWASGDRDTLRWIPVKGISGSNSLLNSKRAYSNPGCAVGSIHSAGLDSWYHRVCCCCRRAFDSRAQ